MKANLKQGSNSVEKEMDYEWPDAHGVKNGSKAWAETKGGDTKDKERRMRTDRRCMRAKRTSIFLE